MRRNLSLDRSGLVAFAALVALFALAPGADAQDKTLITVQTGKAKQDFDGMGCGAVLFEGHITSLAARNKNELQEKLYDDLFKHVPTRYLQIMIRETHEPKNDDNDPDTQNFDEKNFEYCKHDVAIAKAALKRQPDIQLFAVLHTPPNWMKTNNEPTGGGEARATLKPNLELELAEYIWAFLAHMKKNEVPVHYLGIANEPDWPHTQPSYFLTPAQNAALFKTVGDYLDKMAKKHPEVPRVKMVGPNTLSAVGAAKDYLPPVLKSGARHLDVIGAHDYDPRGDRWGALRKIAGKKPLWLTEWCARKKDPSPGMIDSATEYGAAMSDAFNGGANVFMAYDWVYPPRDSGEGLVHVDWGNSYTLTKPYHLFRQWCGPLKPGMKVVEVTGIPGKVAPGVKPTAFLAPDDKLLVVHVVNASDKDAPIGLKLTGKFATATSAERSRTSATEDVKALDALTGTAGSFADTLPARSMVTYRIASAAK